MKISAISAIFAATLGLTAFGAQAANTVTINGLLTSSTCTVAAGDVNKTVTLPTLQSSEFPSAGITKGNTNYTINLQNCTLVSPDTKVGVFYEAGAGVDAASGRLISTGSAANMQVQLLNGDGSVIKAGQDMASQNFKGVAVAADKTAAVTHTAAYYSTGAATAGTVASVVTYDIAYQ